MATDSLSTDSETPLQWGRILVLAAALLVMLAIGSAVVVKVRTSQMLEAGDLCVEYDDQGNLQDWGECP